MNRQTKSGVSLLIGAAALVTFGLASTSNAQVVGFGGSSMTGWTPNTGGTASANGVPNVSGSGTSADVLTLTTANNGEQDSYWFNTPQNITNFSESFTYTDVSGNGADGIGVMWQNAGLNAIGGGGGQLGIGGITSAASLAMNIYGGSGGSASEYNGTIPTPTGNNPVVVPTLGGVNLDSGDPINVTLNYQEANKALTETMTDTLDADTFTLVWRGISIASQVGGSTAYIGFTGSDGGVNAKQTITNFQFTPGAAAPTPVAAIAPIAVTGFNYNMIISAASGTANMTATMDGGSGNTSNAFFEQGVDAAAPWAGVPQAGKVFGSQSDPNHSYVLAPNGPGQNDALMLDPSNTSGLITLVNPAAYTVLSFLIAGANGGGNIDATINYANGGTQSVVFSAHDWFNGSNIAWDAQGRASVSTPNGSFSFNDINSFNPNLYYQDITLTDTTDAVTSINLTYGGSNREVIYGLSGQLAVVPEPASLGVVIGAIGLLARRRRWAR